MMTTMMMKSSLLLLALSVSVSSDRQNLLRFVEVFVLNLFLQLLDHYGIFLLFPNLYFICFFCLFKGSSVSSGVQTHLMFLFLQSSGSRSLSK